MCTIWWSLIFIKSCPCPELIYRKFFRNQSYGEISTPAGSWGTGAFFEEQIATTGRLCAKLSHHPSTRNFKKTFFSFSVFFLSNFHSITISEGKVGFPWQVVLISVPITLPECMNRCTSCTSLARSSERLERVKYQWLSQGCVVTWICGEVQKMLLVDFGSYWLYICLEDIQSLNESFLLVAGTSTTYNLSFWIHEAPKNGTKSDPSVGIHRSGCSTPRVGVV